MKLLWDIAARVWVKLLLLDFPCNGVVCGFPFGLTRTFGFPVQPSEAAVKEELLRTKGDVSAAASLCVTLFAQHIFI